MRDELAMLLGYLASIGFLAIIWAMWVWVLYDSIGLIGLR